MKTLSTFLMFALLISACQEKRPKKEVISEVATMNLPYFNSPDFTPEWEKGTHKIPDFAFINQNGQEITNKNYKGKIYIADFFFASFYQTIEFRN